MAATVVSVVIFLCGVMVGRGVRAQQPTAEAATELGPAPPPRNRHDRSPLSVRPIRPPPPAPGASRCAPAPRRHPIRPRTRATSTSSPRPNPSRTPRSPRQRRSEKKAAAATGRCRAAGRKGCASACTAAPGAVTADWLCRAGRRAARSHRGRRHREAPGRQGLPGLRRQSRPGQAAGLQGAGRPVRRTRRCREDRRTAQVSRAVQPLGYALAIASGVALALSFPRYGHPAFAWVALAPLIVAVSAGAAGGGAVRARRAFLLGLLDRAHLLCRHGLLDQRRDGAVWRHRVSAGGGHRRPARRLPRAVSRALRARPAPARRTQRPLVDLAGAGRVGGGRVRPAGDLRGLPVGPAGLQPGDGAARRATGQCHRRVRAVGAAGGVGHRGGLARRDRWTSPVGRARRRRGPVSPAPRSGGSSGLPEAISPPPGQALRVGIVQGNVDQGIKWDPARADEIFARYLRLTGQVADQGARLVLWPESSTPFYFEHGAESQILRELARRRGVQLLIGSDQWEQATPPRIYNAAFLINADGTTGGVYRKVHLVPFGEYVPFKRAAVFRQAAGRGGVGLRARHRGQHAAGRRRRVFRPRSATRSSTRRSSARACRTAARC